MRPWGKYDREKEAYLSLVDHSLDVAKVVVGLLRIPVFQRIFSKVGEVKLEDIDEIFIQRLGVLALYHDIGKANWGFQNKDGSGKEIAGHTSIVYDLLKEDDLFTKVDEAIFLSSIAGWCEDRSYLINFFKAILSHHGTLCLGSKASFENYTFWTPQRETGYCPIEGLRSLGKAAKDFFPQAFCVSSAKLPNREPFYHAVCGILQLADWLGSDTRNFPIDRQENPSSSIQYVLMSVGLDVQHFRVKLKGKQTDFISSMFPGSSPSPMQSAASDSSRGLLKNATSVEDGTTLVLESETGSGKTEAALLRFQELFKQGLVDGLYFALPTRVAATQIHQRIFAIIKAMFDEEERPEVVLAIPGYLQVDEVKGKHLPEFKVQWEDNLEAKSSSSRWAAENSKRFCAATIAVGTIDQALLSALRCKHSHLRSVSLFRSFLVVDEVHSSDSYMTEILKGLLDNHRGAGGHSLLMSATLGARSREGLLGKEEESSYSEAKKFPFPSISDYSGFKELESKSPPKTVSVELMPFAEQSEMVAERAIAAARKGAKVLVVRNTTSAANKTQRAIEVLLDEREAKDLLPSINGAFVLHHSRFSKYDRQALDKLVEQFMGKESPQGGKIFVGTQTLEQSLDLDADLLITDLCPMDVFLQRIGRLHRHQKDSRPEDFQGARALIITPRERDLGELISSKGESKAGPNGLGGVYPDLRIIELTWRLLEENSTLQLPRDNRLLVEASTHEEKLKELVDSMGGNWLRFQENFMGKVYAIRRNADGLLSKHKETLENSSLVHDLGQVVSTRLGIKDVIVDLCSTPAPPFGKPVLQLKVPRYLLKRNEKEEFSKGDSPEELKNVKILSNSIIFELGGVELIYDRFGVRNEKK